MNDGTTSDDDKVVTDCCGQLLPSSLTLVGDSHYPELCAACQWLDGRPHERHVTCDDTKVQCPGPDWKYIDGQIVPDAPEEDA